MTDQNQTPAPASAEDTFASIRAGRTSHPLHSQRLSDGYEFASVRMTAGGAVLDEGDDEAIATERAAAGVSLSGVQNDIAALSKRLGEINGQLGRVSYDPRTGQQVSALHPTERARFENERNSLNEELNVARKTLAAVLQRREGEQARERMKVENEAAEFEFTQGDKRRAQALADAKLKLEAEQMATWLMRRQYGA